MSYTLVGVPFPKKPTLFLGRLMFCNPRTHSAETWLLFFINPWYQYLQTTLVSFGKPCVFLLLNVIYLHVVSRLNEGL